MLYAFKALSRLQYIKIDKNITMKNAILFGNGLNLLNGGISWNDLLEKISSEPLIEKIPNTLQYETIVLASEKYYNESFIFNAGSVLLSNGSPLYTKKPIEEDIKNKIKEICAEVASSFNVEADLFIEEGYPVLINDVSLTNSLKNKAIDFMGEEKVKDIPQLMTAEDFAWYSHQTKACMCRIGTSNIEKGIVSKQHTPTFDIDEDALEIGMGLMAWLAIDNE